METPTPYTAGTATPQGFVPVRSPGGKLLFCYDPERDLIEWRNGSHVEVIDLRKYKQQP